MGKNINYETIKETFENEGCKLVTTEEEMIINKMKSASKYKIIASCGHPVENCLYYIFKCRKTGKICKECLNKKRSEHCTNLNKETDGNSYSLQIEAQSIQLIKKYVNENIQLRVSPECCDADVAIRDTTCKDNKWLPIQVKSTLRGSYNIYSFGLNRNYNDMIVLFICINEEKFWIIHGNTIPDRIKLSIGMKKSKYNEYQVDKSELSKKLLEFYNLLQTDTIENIQKPLTEKCEKEQEFRKLREIKLDKIDFEYPEVNQCVYDFKINNYKIQEKTAFLKKQRNYFMVMFLKNKNGFHNNPYEVDDNDFYWVNLPDKETFYVIPERVLIVKQIISYGNRKGKKCLSFAEQNTWLNDYKYSYNTYNINEIINNYFNCINKNNEIILDLENINKQLESLKLGSDILKKKVSCYSLENKLIKTYESLSEAERESGATHQAISKCCSGKYSNYKTAKRFIWKYYNLKTESDLKK